MRLPYLLNRARSLAQASQSLPRCPHLQNPQLAIHERQRKVNRICSRSSHFKNWTLSFCLHPPMSTSFSRPSWSEPEPDPRAPPALRLRDTSWNCECDSSHTRAPSLLHAAWRRGSFPTSTTDSGGRMARAQRSEERHEGQRKRYNTERGMKRPGGEYENERPRGVMAR